MHSQQVFTPVKLAPESLNPGSGRGGTKGRLHRRNEVSTREVRSNRTPQPERERCFSVGEGFIPSRTVIVPRPGLGGDKPRPYGIELINHHGT